MRKNKLLVLTVKQLLFITYLIITTVVYFIAMNKGTNGITIDLFGGSNDGYFYWNQAKNIANGQDGILTSIYPLILGYLMKITGTDSVYLIRIFNLFGLVILVLSSLQLIKMLVNSDNKKTEIKYVNRAKLALLVSFMLYASLQMNVNLSIYRDIWIYTFYILSTIFSIKVIFYRENKILNLMLLLPLLLILGGFRDYALLSFIVAILLYTFYRNIKKPKLVTLFLVISFSLYYIFFMHYSVPLVNMSLNDALNYRYRALTLGSGGSQMWINLDQPFFPLFFINYFHSYVGNLLGPLPWHISGFSTLLVFFIETIPMMLILFFLWKKRKLILPIHRYILLHAFVWISLIAVTNDNIGTATRLRPIAWILILIVFTCVYAYSRNLEGENNQS